MKTIKPLKLGILHRTYPDGGKFVFTVTLFVYHDLLERSIHSEASMWKAIADELREGEPLDEGMPKSRTDVLVSGCAYPRGGKAAIGCQVRLKLGKIDKQLYVIGDRHWRADGTPSDPEPFEEMPLSWQRAFGGEGFDANPLGRGFAPTEEDGQQIHRLPNIEHPKKMIVNRKDRPAPVGFGAIDLSWPARQAKAGTYDQEWLETRFPGYAKDIDWTFFNQAPADQQLDGFLRGDEEVLLEGMHPVHDKLTGKLPGVATRCFVNRSGADEEIALEEIKMRIDTVRFIPHLARGIAVFRGVMDVREDDSADIQQLIAGIEELGKPKPQSHYAETLVARLDKQLGGILALRDADLLPEGWAPPEANEQAEELSEHAALIRCDNLLGKNMQRGAEAEMETMRQKMIAAGLDVPEQKVAEPEPPPGIDDLAEYVSKQLEEADRLRKEAEAEQARMEQLAREQCASQGVDFDELVAKRQKELAGPPKFDAAKEIDRMREQARLFRNIGGVDHPSEAALADPKLEEKLQDYQARLRDAYRSMAQEFPAAVLADGDEASALRSAFQAALAAGEPFRERDFTGVNLAGEDLTKASLAGAWLEAADLSGCNLRGVDLSRAVLARASLRGADLEGADLRDANLAEADLEGANLKGTKLNGAVLVRSKLTETKLEGVDFEGANLLEARFERTKLDGAKLAKAMLIQLQLPGISAVGANLEEAVFIECNVADADFTDANLRQVTMVTVDGKRAKFDKVNFANGRVVHQSDFEGASFFGAQMPRTNLRGTRLTGSDFRQADLTGCDLSECDMQNAKLDLAAATDTLFIRTDLTKATATNLNAMNGVLQKANLKGTDLRGANLFRADMAHIRGDKGTKLDGANMDLIRFVDRPRDLGDS